MSLHHFVEKLFLFSVMKGNFYSERQFSSNEFRKRKLWCHPRSHHLLLQADIQSISIRHSSSSTKYPLKQSVHTLSQNDYTFCFQAILLLNPTKSCQLCPVINIQHWHSQNMIEQNVLEGRFPIVLVVMERIPQTYCIGAKSPDIFLTQRDRPLLVWPIKKKSMPTL